MGQLFSDLLKDSSEEVKEELEILQEMGRSIVDVESQRMTEDQNIHLDKRNI